MQIPAAYRSFLLFIALLLLLTRTSHARTLLQPTAAVEYNQRSFIVHGKPVLLMSGSIHYVRVPPSDWNSIFQLAKELGLNCIQTYIMWSEHENAPGHFIWEGNGDLVRFIELAAANDLYVVVRIGPYVCGEYYYGGIPLWMRHQTDDNGAKIKCFRCSDPIWKSEMERWVKIVVNKIHHLLASNGGPIIWMQIENEYDKDDDYLEWAVSMARSITTDVPWSLCGHNISQCNQLNPPTKNRDLLGTTLNNDQFTENSAHQKNVVCTVNGFWVEKGERGSQPGPEFFSKLWSGNPTQPAVWTEDQGWFDIWGMAHRVRSTSDQLYGIARFFAHGGSYHNLYMLTGGNNYGLRAGRDATTAYAPDTAIDNFLLRHEPRFSSFQRFFHVMKDVAHELLWNPVPIVPIPLNISSAFTTHKNKDSRAEVHEYGTLAFLSNFGDVGCMSDYFDFRGESYFLPNHTVIIFNISTREIIFNTSAITDKHGDDKPIPKPRRIDFKDWKYFQEDVGYGAIGNARQTSPEQLNLTKNDSDYLWYTFYTNKAGNISVQDIGWGGLQYCYVDGIRSDSIQGESPADETSASRNLELASQGNTSQLSKKRKVEIFSVAPVGLSNQKKKKVDILSVAMGMSTSVAPEDGKGIESANITNGNNTYTYKQFTTAWKLRGEELEIYTAKGSKLAAWKQMTSPELRKEDGLVWFQGAFEIPGYLLPHVGSSQPNQTAMVVNLKGLNKGMAYVNGFNIGRYWLAKGKCTGKCAPPQHGHYCFLHYEGCGKPTQHLYHIPFEALKPSDNVLTLFEEAPSSKSRTLDKVFLQVIHNHPEW